MAKYTNAALVCALTLMNLNGSSAWTQNSNIRSTMRRSESALSAFRAKVPIPEDPYVSLESIVTSPDTASKSKSVVEAVQAKAQVAQAAIENSVPSVNVEVPPSIFEPIQSALTKIIETEQALNNMEHTALSNAAKFLLNILNSFDEAYAFFASSILSVPAHALQEIISSSVAAAKSTAASVDVALLDNPIIGPVLNTIQQKAMALSPIIGEELASLPPSVGILASAGITYGIISTVLSIGEGPPPSSPYPLGRYDPSSARQYFDQRLGDVIARGVEIAGLSTKFALGLLKDYSDDKLEANADIRAKELAVLLTELGPTFSKYQHVDLFLS